MKVAAKKQAGRSKKRRGASLLKNESIPEDEALQTGVTSAADEPKKTVKTRRVVKDVSNHKITEFFPVRRSSRKTSKQIEVRK